MRQHISSAQLQELSPEQQEKLREWWEPKQGDFYIDYVWEMKHIVSSYHVDETIVDMDEEFNMKKDCLPRLNIGQCIELLNCNYGMLADIFVGIHFDEKQPELINALFEAVKAVL